MMQLAERDRRTLLLGVASVVAILALGRGIPALRRWESAHVAEAAEMRELLRERQSGAASMPHLRDSAAVRSARLTALRRQLISAATVEAATAVLAARIERMAAEAAVEVLTTTLRPDSAMHGGFARVAVRMSADGDVDGLADLLFALESDVRMLTVSDLTVSQPDPSAPDNSAEVLRIELSVIAVAQIIPPAPRKKA